MEPKHCVAEIPFSSTCCRFAVQRAIGLQTVRQVYYKSKVYSKCPTSCTTGLQKIGTIITDSQHIQLAVRRVACQASLFLHNRFLFLSFQFVKTLFCFLCICQPSGQKHHVSRVFGRPSLPLEQIFLPRYLAYLLMEFDQTCITNGLWGKDKRFKF